MLPELVAGQTNDDKGVVPEFYMHAIQNTAKSEEEGRPIFDDVEMVRIYTIGDKYNIPEHKVKDKDRARWPREYEAFKANGTIATTGTPLEEWPALSLSRVKELKALKITTVETLADLPEGSIHAIGMGGRGLIEKAKAFIQAAAGNAIAEKMAKDNASLKRDLEMLREQVAELKDGDLALTVAALKKENAELKLSSKPKKRGRKKKV